VLREDRPGSSERRYGHLVDPFVNLTICLGHHLDIKLVADGYENDCFRIIWSMAWRSFYSQDQARFSAESKGPPLFHKVHDALRAAEPGFIQLHGEKDSAEAMMAGKWASRDSRDLELETVHRVSSDPSHRT